jgi:hypothetical protein
MPTGRLEGTRRTLPAHDGSRASGPLRLAGNPVRRLIEIDVAAGESRRLLLWLDAVSRDHIVLGVQPLEL